MRSEPKSVPGLDEKEDRGLEKSSYCNRQWVGLQDA